MGLGGFALRIVGLGACKFQQYVVWINYQEKLAKCCGQMKLQHSSRLM